MRARTAPVSSRRQPRKRVRTDEPADPIALRRLQKTAGNKAVATLVALQRRELDTSMLTPLPPAAEAVSLPPDTRPAPEVTPLPAAAGAVSQPGMLVGPDDRLNGTTVTMSQDGSRVDTDTRKLTSHATTSTVATGDVTHTTASKAGVSGLGYGQSSSDTVAWAIPDGEAASRTSSSAFTGKVGANGLTLGGTSSNETVVTKPVPAGAESLDDVPDPVKTGSSLTGSVNVGPHGYGATGGYSTTSAGGTTSSVTGGASFDYNGNHDVNAGAGLSHGGKSASATVGEGHHVTAGEPVLVAPGVWEVAYTVEDSLSGGVSGSGGGFGGGVSGSRATQLTGTRRFTSETEAKDFHEHPNSWTDNAGLDTGAPVTSVKGALAIPVGESRGVGGTTGSALSASAAFEGASVAYGRHSSAGEGTSVRHVSGTLVQVTAKVTTEKGSDWTLSTLGFSDDKGSSESHLFEITFEFDLKDERTGQAFESFCTHPLPTDAGRRVSVHQLDTQEDHDAIKLAGSSDTCGAKTSQDRLTTDAGTTAKYGGAQTHDATPGLLGKVLGDKETHSSAQIVRTDENGKDAGARAELDVSGKSGEANRAEFAKIFGTAGSSGDAEASGDWTLTAKVPMAVLKELEEVSPRLREAKTMDEKMRVYSELVKENGAAMLGGQVGMTSQSWDLQLKGDDNFPGEAGRARLNDLAKELRAQLKAKPASADQVVHQAETELAALRKRRAAVADPKRYTDLPGRLRTEQLSVIDHHIGDFTGIRANGQAASMRLSGEAAKGSDAAYSSAQGKVAGQESTIGDLGKQVHTESKALGDVIGRKGTAALRDGVEAGEATYAVAIAKAMIGRATDADGRQNALESRISAARDAAAAATDAKDRLTRVQALSEVLGERVTLMRECLDDIREAAKAIGPVADPAAMSGHADFWKSVGVL